MPQVGELIRELAVFEQAGDQVYATPDMYVRDGFGDHPLFSVFVAESEDVIQGIAFCYVRYSTWKGPMLYLEDLFVRESHRGKGMGFALFRRAMQEAAARGYHGMVWQVLDWNTSAIAFYEGLGARVQEGWLTMSLSSKDAEPMLSA
jgi:GNAT superfamily N-acetyltransferase